MPGLYSHRDLVEIIDKLHPILEAREDEFGFCSIDPVGSTSFEGGTSEKDVDVLVVINHRKLGFETNPFEELGGDWTRLEPGRLAEYGYEDKFTDAQAQKVTDLLNFVQGAMQKIGCRGVSFDEDTVNAVCPTKEHPLRSEPFERGKAAKGEKEYVGVEGKVGFLDGVPTDVFLSLAEKC